MTIHIQSHPSRALSSHSEHMWCFNIIKNPDHTAAIWFPILQVLEIQHWGVQDKCSSLPLNLNRPLNSSGPSVFSFPIVLTKIKHLDCFWYNIPRGAAQPIQAIMQFITLNITFLQFTRLQRCLSREHFWVTQAWSACLSCKATSLRV